MKVLVVTNMYPTPDYPAFGTFIRNEVEALRRNGVEIDVCFINGRKNKLDYVWGTLRFWRQILRSRYDLVHAHYTLSGLVARLQWRYPVVMTHCGSDVLSKSWVATLSKLLHPLFDRVIVVSREMWEVFKDDRTTVIPRGINLEEMRPIPQAEAREQLGLPPDKPLILWAGQYWQPVKRFALTQQAVALVQEVCPEAELVVVARKSHSVMPLYMNACDVIMLTSTTEGSPNVIKEAMACNLPIVSVDVGDVAEIIAGVEGCYIVEPNAATIAEKLLLVLEKWQRTRGREKMASFDFKVITQRIIAVYRQLCAS
jgi:teichuronic acid biosynthesis glycosyltransferase TuaC